MQRWGPTCFGLRSMADRLRSFGQGDEERIVNVLIICFFSLSQHLKHTQHDKHLATQMKNSTESLEPYFSV